MQRAYLSVLSSDKPWPLTQHANPPPSLHLFHCPYCRRRPLGFASHVSAPALDLGRVCLGSLGLSMVLPQAFIKPPVPPRCRWSSRPIRLDGETLVNCLRRSPSALPCFFRIFLLVSSLLPCCFICAHTFSFPSQLFFLLGVFLNSHVNGVA